MAAIVIEVLRRNFSEILLSESVVKRENMSIQLFKDGVAYGEAL